MKRNHLIIAGVVTALLLVGIFLVLGGPSGGPRAGRGEDRGIGDIFFREGREGFLTPNQIEKMMARGMSPKAELEMARTYFQYPHDSRPLTASMKDLTDPWKVEFLPLPAPLPGASTEKEMEELIEQMKSSGKSTEEIEKEIAHKIENQPAYQFTLNRHTITEGDTMVATLKVTKNGAPIPYNISSAEIESDLMFGSKGLGSAPYNDAGAAPDSKASDGITTFTWKAPSGDRLNWGTLTLKVKASITGLKDPVILQQSFYSSPKAPAEFSNQFSERLQDGSLVIDVPLDVRKECRYNLQANLYSLDEDEPTHWVVVQKILSPGRQIVSFNFFGKIFRDGGYAGKFQLRDLRGTCEIMPFPPSWLGDPSKMEQITNTPPLNEPPLMYIPFNTLTYTTRSYSATDFSDRPNSTDEAREKIRQLEEAANQQ
ncbi:MAG: hypothetical protein JNM27_10155 [Leptospirales bacterium]|nr:hypothetical protein [Leptospirales bacterium]